MGVVVLGRRRESVDLRGRMSVITPSRLSASTGLMITRSPAAMRVVRRRRRLSLPITLHCQCSPSSVRTSMKSE